MIKHWRYEKHYGLFACFHCHELQYCNLTQKTRQCVKCRTKLILSEINFIAYTDDIQEAISVLQEMKKRIGQRKGWEQLISADKLLKNAREEND